MSEISVILSYRDRDIARLQRCLDSLNNQSFKNFQVLFIDYGSSEAYRKPVEKLVSSYSFCRYVFVYSQGLAFNRAHAMNIGIRLSEGEYLLLSDIDIIHSKNHLQVLNSHQETNSSIYHQVYLLPQRFVNYHLVTNYNAITKHDLTLTDKASKGIHFIKKSVLEEIRGYDEFYCFWGVEDRDLHARLHQKGIKESWLAPEQAPLFHQWHPTLRVDKEGFIPDKWWEDMNIYYQINIHRIVRNSDDWARLLVKEDRIVLSATERYFDFKVEKKGVSAKVDLISKLYEGLMKLQDNECLVILLANNPAKTHSKILTAFIILVNKIFKVILPSLRIDRCENFYYESPFLSSKYMLYIIWRLIAFEKIIKDYSIIQDEDSIRIKICKY